MIYTSERCAVVSISILFCFLTTAAEGFYHFQKASLPPVVGDAGDPLFITPLLEKGEFEKARLLAKVPPLAGRINSYAGFLTVNKTYNSNHFFWFFPALKSPEKAPVVVWLQGGPGASSLFGLFSEHGPYAVMENHTIFLRQYSWTKTLSMLYIDNPVGAGFSFTKQDEGYCTCQEEVAENLYRTVAQFFQLFPKFLKNDFYVTGESYGGKYAPALAYAIHERNKASDPKINLKGVAIGNGFSDPRNMMGYGDYLYQIGLIDTNIKIFFNEAKDKAKKLIDDGKLEEAFEIWNELLDGDMTKKPTLFFNVTGFRNYFNYLYSTEVDIDATAAIVQQSSVREKIHVGKLKFNIDEACEFHLKGDMMRSVAPWIVELLDNGYKFMVYNGQLDVIVAYPLTVEFLQNLQWSGLQEYKNATRNIWKVNPGDKEVAGYVRIVRNLVEVLVRNAGHMVPSDQPRVAYDLINRFVFDKKFFN